MQNCWLDIDEQEAVCELLLHYNLLEYSNDRRFKRANGQTTDVYINIRNARNHPSALEKIARYYENPLRRLRPDRFVEVPHAVSCFAPLISVATRIPYITIREAEKPGRVVKGKAIGSGYQGDQVCLLDDVIADGGSKIEPYRECLAMGLEPSHLVVLINRQEGWERKFAENNIQLPVWAGMTLHDVRRYLIESGSMERCNPEVEGKNPIIVALDGKSWKDILPIAERLRTTGCILKVTDLLFNKGIEWLLPNLSIYGRVMADIKGYDIDNTLENIVKCFHACPPWAVTVHASGQEGMIRRVVEVLKDTPTKVLVVTLLTSFDKKMCEEVYVQQPVEVVKKLADIAYRSDADGFVCASDEVPIIRQMFGREPTIVTPGIRSEGVDHDDQKRTDTPSSAWRKGTNHLVIGRQILNARDPVAEVKRILNEELHIA